MNPDRRALISVADKTGIEAFAKALIHHGFSIVSTGGTASVLRRAGVVVEDVSEVTGFPEIMGGRVKTLNPLIHGGLLGRPDTDAAVMEAHGIRPINLLVVNLYPFEATVADPGCTREQAIENIDIGGPAMIRAAAKNHAHVAVVVDGNDYRTILSELDAEKSSLTLRTRRYLARKAFAHTAFYDAAISGYLYTQDGDSTLPAVLALGLRRQETLRYGENPHQRAALYTLSGRDTAGLTAARQLQGKALSFNNIADTNAALECMAALSGTACVIVKHANPCGAAIGDSQEQAYEKAYATDPASAFGGIIVFNAPIRAPMARTIINRQFVEVIAAPGFDESAVAALRSKPNIRVLEIPPLRPPGRPGLEVQQITGGMLVQDTDVRPTARDDVKVVTDRQPTAQELTDALFAWSVAQFVKSNAIVYCRDGATLGVGAGQMSRVMSARIAAWKAAEAGLDLTGAAMASDAFFPFRDGIDTAGKHGVSVVIQPGGSIRDEEVIRAANEHDMAMLFTGIRHFRH